MAKDASTTSSGQDPRVVFVDEARKHIGSGGHSWVVQVTGCSRSMAWCAATMYAVAKTVGVAGKIMPDSRDGSLYMAGGFGEHTITKYGGSYIKGGYLGGTDIPQKGDLALFSKWRCTWGKGTKYAAGHIGVVDYVEGTTVHTIEGNTGGTYKAKEHNLKDISWYARPDWSKVGTLDPSLGSGYISSGGVGVMGPLYATASTRADATMREVCYMTASGKPSIKATELKLSVINYTGLLAQIVALMGGGTSGTTADDYSQIPEVPRQIIQYLVGRGLNTAAACGIVGNIQSESNFNTASVGDHGTSFGICQWHLGRGTAMKAMAGSNWASNLTGQLDYLWHELSTSYNKSVLAPLKNVPDTLAGAKEAADIFVRKFEVPANVDAQSKIRQENAASFYNKVIKGVSVAGSGASTQYTSGTAQKVVTIPSSVNQTGMTGDDCTNYWYWSTRMGYTQGKLGRIWQSKGCTAINGLSVIDGLYCVATTKTFGAVGDVIKVMFTDGTSFDGIIVDQKSSGDSNYNMYGHVKSNGKISIIEWYLKGPSPSSSSVGRPTQSLKAAGFNGKMVASIANYGKYKGL